MTRLFSSVLRETKVQARSGFYWVSIFVAIFFVSLLLLLPNRDVVQAGLVAPAFALVNLMTTTFYFMAGLVLLEKAESSLLAMSMSPLRTGEYLFAKAASLSALATAETFVVIWIAYGIPPNLAAFLLGAFSMALIYSYWGFVAVAPFESINKFLLPSVLFVTVALLPLIEQFRATGSTWLLWHPLMPSQVLMQSAYEGFGPFAWSYGLIGACVSLLIVVLFALRRYERHANDNA